MIDNVFVHINHFVSVTRLQQLPKLNEVLSFIVSIGLMSKCKILGGLKIH